MNQEKVKPLFLFDMGNVVIKNIDPNTDIANHYNIPVEEFLDDMKRYDHPLMDGEISTYDYWRHIEHKFNVKIEGDPLHTFFKPVPNPIMIDFIKKLKENGYRVVSASNTIEEHWVKLEEYRALFDEAYPSHVIRLTKPSRQYFEYILEKENTKVEDAFFIDDMLENIETARRIGLPCFHYTNDGDLKELIKQFV